MTTTLTTSEMFSSMSFIHLLYFYEISGIHLGRYWTYAVCLEMTKTCSIAIFKKSLMQQHLLAVSFQKRVHTDDSISR